MMIVTLFCVPASCSHYVAIIDQSVKTTVQAGCRSAEGQQRTRHKQIDPAAGREKIAAYRLQVCLWGTCLLFVATAAGDKFLHCLA
jgi:hypothetical protein